MSHDDEQPANDKTFPFESPLVISALHWAELLIVKYAGFSAGNGVDSWLMNYGQANGDPLRLQDFRDWRRVHGQWVASPKTSKPVPLAKQDLKWCGHCGEGYAGFCRSKGAAQDCHMQTVSPAVSDDEILLECGDFAVDSLGKTNLIRIGRELLNFAASKVRPLPATESAQRNDHHKATEIIDAITWDENCR